MLEHATETDFRFSVSDIELQRGGISYTIDTLAYLREKYPDKQFVLIMGGDNLATLSKWKNAELLLRDYFIYVYKRAESTPPELADHPHIRFFEAPLLDISSTYIRQCLRHGKSIQYLVTEPVYQYIMSSNLYR